MSEIAPNTIVRFLSGVPLEINYENSVYWDKTNQTWLDQSTKLAEYTKAAVTDPQTGNAYRFYLDKQSYQRYARNAIRVQIPADLLRDCNYLMFKNDRFGSKWFYAFVTRVEYVNEVTSTVYYEIDVLQTWYFDFDVNACFVERCHANSDIIGSNLIEENLQFGEYMFKTPTTVSQLSDIAYYIVAPWKATITVLDDDIQVELEEVHGGKLMGGTYSGIYVTKCETAGILYSVIREANETLGDQSQAIVNIYAAPSNADLENESALTPATYTTSKTNDVTTFNGYTPHNKKLFTWPYRGLQVFTGAGESNTYRYEFFAGARNAKAGLASWSCLFDVVCDPTPTGTCYLVPRDYKTVSGYATGRQNWYESMAMGSYPQLSWTTDAYTSYLAQDGTVQAIRTLGSGGSNINDGGVSATGASIFGNIISPIFGGITSIGEGNIGRGLTSAVSGVTSALMENLKAQNMPDSTGGTSSGSQLKLILDKQQFQFMPFSITREYAEILDGFFDYYGYAQKKVMRPSLHNRKYWTFVKTKDCSITGTIPADDAKLICDIFNNGVRWWVNVGDIGNFYNLAAENAPLLD